jgi:hypothetical protein
MLGRQKYHQLLNLALRECLQFVAQKFMEPLDLIIRVGVFSEVQKVAPRQLFACFADNCRP